MEVYVNYFYDYKDLDKILKVGGKVRDAKNAINEKYDGQVDCNAGKDYRQNFFYVGFNYKKQFDDLMPAAIEDYIRIAGVPDFVESHYNMLKPIVAQYGKRLKRKFSGCSDGKHIVDIK